MDRIRKPVKGMSRGKTRGKYGLATDLIKDPDYFIDLSISNKCKSLVKSRSTAWKMPL